MAQLISKQFCKALSYLLAKEGRGAQSRLSSQQNIDRGYLNAIVKGRKPGSEKVRTRIATHFKMTYEEMLAFGRRLLAKEDVEEGRKDTDESGQPINGLEVILPQTRKKTTKGDFSISEMIKKTADILKSDTRYRDILSQTIETLHDSISKERENLTQQNQMKEMEHRIASLEKKLAGDKNKQRKSA